MQKRSAIIILALSLGCPYLFAFDNARILHVMALQSAMTDNIGSGYCGRGVFSVLSELGLGKHIKSANGEDWFNILAAAGWKPIRCREPRKAPPGTVLVYFSDPKMKNKPPRNNLGGKYGHVEFVVLDAKGVRWYVSDAPRPNPGGSVPDNFSGVAWAPPRFNTILLNTGAVLKK